MQVCQEGPKGVLRGGWGCQSPRVQLLCVSVQLALLHSLLSGQCILQDLPDQQPCESGKFGDIPGHTDALHGLIEQDT